MTYVCLVLLLLLLLLSSCITTGAPDAVYVFITSTNVEHKEAIMESIAMPLGIGQQIEDKARFKREIK